jgi:hypothetical protein
MSDALRLGHWLGRFSFCPLSPTKRLRKFRVHCFRLRIWRRGTIERSDNPATLPRNVSCVPSPATQVALDLKQSDAPATLPGNVSSGPIAVCCMAQPDSPLCNPFRPFAMACRTLCASGFNRDCKASQAGHNRPQKNTKTGANEQSRPYHACLLRGVEEETAAAAVRRDWATPGCLRLACAVSNAASVEAGLVVSEQRKTRPRTACWNEFSPQHAGLMLFDGQRSGRTRVSMAAIRQLNWRKRPLVLLVL